MVLTYTLCLGLTYWVVRCTRKSWDYVVTSSILHLVLCIIGGSRVLRFGATGEDVRGTQSSQTPARHQRQGVGGEAPVRRAVG